MKSFTILSGFFSAGCLFVIIVFICMHSGMYFTKDQLMPVLNSHKGDLVSLGSAVVALDERLKKLEPKKAKK